MTKVVIKSIVIEHDDWDREATEVLVDGESIGYFSYGGEPEDNMRGRTYRWVEPLLKVLAEKLGATAEIRKTTKASEDD